MNVTFSNEVYIESSLENVYSYLSKMENFSTWNYAVISVEPIENDNLNRNGSYILKRDLGNKVETETVTVIETKNNEMLHFHAAGGRFLYEMKYDLKQSGNGTILNNTAIMKPEGRNVLLLKLLKKNIQAEVKNNLHVLKHLLEKG